MRRLYRPYLLLCLLAVASFILAGCGGGSNTTTLGPVTTVTLAPTPASLEFGQTLQIVVTAKDAKGHVVFNHTPTWTSDQATVQIANNGVVCGGTWDSLTTPVVCTAPAAPTPVVANITATVQGITSAPLPVYVHAHIDNITVTPSIDFPACLSNGQTQQYTAKAFSNGVDITSTVGGFTWSISNPAVASTSTDIQPANQPSNQITAKGVAPGMTTLVATNSNTNSTGAQFTTCGPASISLHVTNSTNTALSVAVGATGNLTADIVDQNGKTITSTGLLTYSSSSPAASATNAGVVNGLSVGQASITASCTPPACNVTVNQPIYSNPVVVTVTGTAKANTVWVTSTGFGTLGCNSSDATKTCTPVLVPVPTDTNTPGTAIVIPDLNNVRTVPNSMLMSQGGSKIALGSSNGLVLFDTATNSITFYSGAPGKALAFSPSAVKVAVGDSVNNKTYIIDIAGNTIDTLNGAAVAAVWTTDGLKAYFVVGTNLYQYAPSILSLRTIAIGDTGKAEDMLPGGQFLYLATASGNLGARSTCRNDSTYAPESTVSTDSGLQFVRGVTLSSGTNAIPKMLDVGGTNITVDTPTIAAPPAGVSCPPSITSSTSSANWGSSFTPHELITLSTGTQAYIPSDQTVLLGYDVVAGTTFTVPVSGVAQYTGGATLDGTKVYVGGTDNALHVIDTATKLQSTTVPITFNTSATSAVICNNNAICKPDLVTVQPK